jgi:pimeloyl-ACP methyl ester carboxylesterase
MTAASQTLWAGVGDQLDVPSPGGEAARAPIQQRRRRGFDAQAGDGRAAVRLLRDDGLLRWVYEPPVRQLGTQGRRSWRAFSPESRETVQRIAFPELGANQLTDALRKLDRRLNPVLAEFKAPSEGLRRWNGQAWAPLAADELATLTGRVLVLVHGTFSASAMYAKEFTATVDGETLLQRLADASGTYAAVLAFDHPTLSVAPWLNALALRDALAPCPAEFDFVGHSRGGLVISWLLRMAPELRARQALFVGSPLAGTSLAAPDKLRQALDTLASFADAVTEAAAQARKVAPPGLQVLALGVGGLACVLGKVLELGARTPLADAAVGLVPGLLAQGRVNNNLELEQLYPLPAGTEVRAIGGSFMPSEVNEPLWKLWKRVTNLKGQAMYYGADLIFDQPNDLVVDSASMNRLGDLTLAAPHWEDLGVSAQTHHTNYFQDLRVLSWLDARLR